MTYSVTLQPSGHRYEVPEGKSILSAGLEAGNFMPYSCKQGVCNSCKGRIVEGRVDYGDSHPAYFTDADRAAGLALLCQSRPLSDCVIEVRELEGISGIKSKIIPCRVTDLNLLAPDVMYLRVRLPMNENMPFISGQYVDFLFKDGARRSYSIANTHAVEGVRALEFHIRHLPGGAFTDKLFTGAIKVNELMRFEGPLGSFYLRDSKKPAVFVASGTGFGPIKAMIEFALTHGDKRPMTLYWGCRSKRDLYQFELPQEWARAYPNFTYVPVLSEPQPEDGWSGRTGFVHRAVLDDCADMSGHQVYACGAPVVVESARRDCTAQRGLPDDEFFADSFLTAADVPQPSTLSQPSAPQPAAAQLQGAAA
jgi:CDP-4-dehydro-6-deoxyglucose reductase, E3